MYEYLSPKKVLFEYKFDKDKFNYLINTITSYFNNSIINYGEMVGAIAAQHIGEVATQPPCRVCFLACL